MTKAYLFIYNDEVGSRDEVKETLNSIPSITHWRYDIPHSFYVVSDGSAQDLYDRFAAINGTKGRFMFVEVSTNRQGQMLTDTWYFFTNKTYKPKDSAT